MKSILSDETCQDTSQPQKTSAIQWFIYLLIPYVKSRPNFIGMTVDRSPGDKETLDFHHGKSRRTEVNLRFNWTWGIISPKIISSRHSIEAAWQTIQSLDYTSISQTKGGGVQFLRVTITKFKWLKYRASWAPLEFSSCQFMAWSECVDLGYVAVLGAQEGYFGS